MNNAKLFPRSPNALPVDRLSDAEKGAMLQVAFFYMRHEMRLVIQREMPAAYARLMDLPLTDCLQRALASEAERVAKEVADEHALQARLAAERAANG